MISQQLTQIKWTQSLYSLPAFFSFNATHINKIKAFLFAQGEESIAHYNLSVNFWVKMCSCCTQAQFWWINHSAKLLGSEALSQTIKMLRRRDKLQSATLRSWPLSLTLWPTLCLHAARVKKLPVWVVVSVSAFRPQFNLSCQLCVPNYLCWHCLHL